MHIDTVLQHYIIAALWSSTDDDGEPLDKDYDASSFAPETLQAMRDDVTAFVSSNFELLDNSGISAEQIGHDFWLTRNHHGAGFWDRGLGELGELLTELSQTFNDVDLYIGDDGQIYQ